MITGDIAEGAERTNGEGYAPSTGANGGLGITGGRSC